MTLQVPYPWFYLFAVGSVLAAVGLLAVVHQSSNQMKRGLTVVCTFLAGLFYFLEFFIPPNPATNETNLWGWNLTATQTTVGQVVQVIAGLAFLLGVFNLARIHGNNVGRMRAGWPYSLAFFLGFAAMVLFAFWRDWKTWFPAAPTPPIWVKDSNPAHAIQPHDAYTLLFEGLLRNLDASMFSILAFYIVSAAYRAFRIRSAEAAILMVVALILMMGQVPLGMFLTKDLPTDGPLAILRIENFSQYVLTAVNAPVQRAIGFGLGLGLLAMGLRIWLSLEQSSFFEEEA
jgi:hypothetical protein